MTVVLHHRVRYHEVDAQGFMFNSRFLEVADVAMTEYFRALGHPYLELVAAGVDPSVTSALLTFLRPARFEDELEVDVVCPRVGTSSFDLLIEIRCDDAVVASVKLTYVNVNALEATSRPLTEAVANSLRKGAATATRL